MALEERRTLHSVELIYASKTIHVKWLDQIVKDGTVIKETPHRCAYAADGVPDRPDAEKPFAAEAIIRANVEQFAERLATETEAHAATRTQLEDATKILAECRGILEQTKGLLGAAHADFDNARAVIAKREQELKEARFETLEAVTTSAKLRDKVADLRARLAGRSGAASG